VSRTKKEGKRTKYSRRARGDEFCAWQRHSFGSTEKIRRRNRKTWTRLGNKRRRAADKETANFCHEG
jgi:hypothetical protein